MRITKYDHSKQTEPTYTGKQTNNNKHPAAITGAGIRGKGDSKDRFTLLFFFLENATKLSSFCGGYDYNERKKAWGGEHEG